MDPVSIRRNPLSPAQQRRAKQEIAKLSSSKEPDQVYALALGSKDDPIIFYVGVSIHPEIRFKQHQQAIKLGVDPKPAYEYARYHKRKDTLHLIVLDAEGDMTEEDWRKELFALGHPLQNAVGGNDVKRKKRVKKPSVDPTPLPGRHSAEFLRVMATARKWDGGA